MATIQITFNSSVGADSALTNVALLSNRSSAARQVWANVDSNSSLRTKALVGLGQVLWPLCQEGLARLVCRISADRGRCLKVVKATSELANSRVSGRLLLAAGVAVDAWRMKKAISRSVESRTVRPAAAQATRSLTTWGAAWAGAELLGIGGALAGLETGPGALVTGGLGALVGGCVGMFASDWLAQKIEPRLALPDCDADQSECAC